MLIVLRFRNSLKARIQPGVARLVLSDISKLIPAELKTKNVVLKFFNKKPIFLFKEFKQNMSILKCVLLKS